MSDFQLATLHDYAARFGENGNKDMQTIIELQSKTNKILDVMTFKPCNDKTREMATLRAALPEVAWRMINRGVTPTKSASKQESFTTGQLEAFADIDENSELPGSEWEYNFSEQNGITKVTIRIYNESLERLERMIAMGFKEGFTMSIDNLENLLEKLSNH